MVQVKKFDENPDRFKGLVLYISQKCANDPNFDTLKLTKTMFFADFLAYAKFGKPITGSEYVKKQKGPVPRNMGVMLKEMESEKALGLQHLPLKTWPRPVNLRNPDLGEFKAEQIALVDDIIDALRPHDGELVSTLSHDWLCWNIPALEDTIPYELVYVSLREPTPADVERGKAVAKELNLLEPVAAQSA